MRCAFVPPYLLRRLAQSTPDQAAGTGTLRIDDDVRSQRQRRAGDQQRPRLRAVDAGRRVVHDAQHREELPGVIARRDDDPPTGDVAVDEAFAASGQVWDLFAEQFAWPSVDGNGSTMSVTVHFGMNYDNAFWDGSQLVFGDGDGEIFDRFTKPMDVMAHEFTHGVVQFTANLAYRDQAGALNESVSDVFASLALQRVRGQTADAASWLIGEGLFLPGINASALRSMREPGTAYDDPRLGKDPQVGSMADYVETDEDSGGVHINSGIPNRAFALVALNLGGASWERAGRIWFDTLTSGELAADTDFEGFAAATVRAATKQFADDPAVVDAVRKAWRTVGLLELPSGSTTSIRPSRPAEGERLAVRRSGGFAGTTRSAELDLTRDPAGEQVRRLLAMADLQHITTTELSPDRFVYTLEYGEVTLKLPEQDLTPELREVVRIVFDAGMRRD